MTKPKPRWVPLSAYCAEYCVDRRTLQKWADAGVVRIERVTRPDTRPLLRILNRPPWAETSSP